LGLTVPLSVADELVTFVAALVVTVGGPPTVVNVMSLLWLVPPLFIPTSRK